MHQEVSKSRLGKKVSKQCFLMNVPPICVSYIHLQMCFTTYTNNLTMSSHNVGFSWWNWYQLTSMTVIGKAFQILVREKCQVWTSWGISHGINYKMITTETRECSFIYCLSQNAFGPKWVCPPCPPYKNMPPLRVEKVLCPLFRRFFRFSLPPPTTRGG